MIQPTDEQLLEIAREHISSLIPTLKTRSVDHLDFYEMAVWNIEAMLKAAYELGYKAAGWKE